MTSDNHQLKFDDDVFVNNSRAQNFVIITESITAGRKTFGQPFEYQIQIQNETRSQSFAVLPPVPDQRTAVLREDDAAR